METRRLGRTGFDVSVLCLGTMVLSRWGNTDEDDCVRIIHRALDAGVNFVDTAEIYANGQAERVLGRALRGRREGLVVATKVNPSSRQEGEPTRDWIRRAAEGSLRRLDVEVIDLYQLHRPDPASEPAEVLEALGELVTEGKVRALGSSTFPAWQLYEARWGAEAGGLEPYSTEQPPYSILARAVELDVLPVARRLDLGVLVYSPLAGGWLSGKYRPGEPLPEGSRGDRMRSWGPQMVEAWDPSRDANVRRLELVGRLAAVAADAGLSLPALAYAFTHAHPAVTSTIAGPRTMDHLEAALAEADVRLDAATLDAIDAIVEPGSVVEASDRGWNPPWMSPQARRRTAT